MGQDLRSAPVARGLRSGAGGRRPSAAKATVRGWLHGRILHHATPVVAALLVTSGALLGGYNSAAGRCLACLTMVALSIFLLLLGPPTLGSWRRALPILAPSLTAIAWALLSALVSAPLAPDMLPASLLGVIAGWLALLCGWLLALRPKRVGPLVDLLLLLNLTFLLAGLVMRALDAGSRFDFWTLSWHGRFAGTIGNSNTTAAVAGACALLATGRSAALVRSRGRLVGRADAPRLFLLLLGLVIAFGALLATASRFVALLSAVGVIALGGWTLWRQRERLARIVPIVAVAAVLVGTLLIQRADLLVERYGALGTEGVARVAMWRHYAGLAAESPWLGYGHGGFAVANTMGLRPGTALSLEPVGSAHDIVLQLILAAGIPYALLMIGAAVALALRLLHTVRERHWSPILLGLIGAVGVILGTAMIDIALDVPAGIILAMFLAGLAWGQADGPEGYRRGTRRRRQASSTA
jgi:O-antigen ligase